MAKKETSIKKQAEKKAVDDALITAVLSRVAEIGVRKAAAEAGIAWQTVNKWMKEKEKEKKTPDEIKEVVEEIAEVVATTVEEKAAEPAATSVEEKKAPVAEEKADEPVATNVEEKAVVEEKADEPLAPVVEERVDLIIESTMGGQISADEIINRVKEKRSDAAKIYVKPEENKAYFTYGDSVGAIELW